MNNNTISIYKIDIIEIISKVISNNILIVNNITSYYFSGVKKCTYTLQICI